jgi:hypothetical protein
MAAVTNVPVSSEAQLEQTITSYIARGFVLANRTATSATMFKKKEFSILWAVIGLVLCLLPLLIYLIIYASQSDQMVQVYVVDPAALPAAAAPSVVNQVSPDGLWRWDGNQWVPTAGSPAPAGEVTPPAVPSSPPDV